MNEPYHISLSCLELVCRQNLECLQTVSPRSPRMLHAELHVCLWWGSRGADVERNLDKKECTSEVSDSARTLENWVRGHGHYTLRTVMAVRTTHPG